MTSSHKSFIRGTSEFPEEARRSARSRGLRRGTAIDRKIDEVDRSVNALYAARANLRPLLLTTVNEPLSLTPERAAAASPVLLPVVGGSALPVVVACGDNETVAFQDQSRRFAEHLRIGGMSVSSLECAPRHHFDIVDDLVDPLTELGRFTLGVR